MRNVTVDDVLRLALPPGAEAVVPVGLTRPVTGVALLRPTPPALPNLHGGEIVLLSVANLLALDEGLDVARFIQRLVGAPIAAIGLLGSADETAQEAALQAHFPLLTMPLDADLRDVVREIQRLLNDPEAQMERRAGQLFSALTRDAIAGGSVQSLLETLQRWTGHEARYMSGRSARPGVTPVVVGGRQVGALQILSDGPWDRLATEQGAAALALLLDKERAVQAAEDRYRGELLDVLVAGIPFDSDVTLRRGNELGYDLTRPHIALVLLPEQGISPERLEAGLRREIDRDGRRGPVGRRGSAVLCLYPPSSPELAKEELKLVHQRLVSGGLKASGGMSGLEPMDAWPSAVIEAEQALTLGRQIFGAGQLLAAADMGIYRLLLLLRDRPEIQEFYNRTIGLLVAYEGRPDGELLQTLSVYFTELGNHTKAAKSLYIHRNTLLYRLGRISQIAGLDLDDEEDRLALQIGLRIHRLIQSRER